MAIVNADKTKNKYEMSAYDYRQLLHDNITRDYKLDNDNKLASINRDTKDHARTLEIKDKMECHSESNAFITIKDHKEGFPNSIKCRIINPASISLGKVSKDTGQNKRQVQRSYWRKPMEKHKRRFGLVHKRACSQPHQDENKIPTVRHMRILSINNRRTTPQIHWFR